MLPFDILTADNHVHSFEPACLLRRSKRFPQGLPQNAWEDAMLHVQEQDAPSDLGTLRNTSNSASLLRYCAAHVLLAHRSKLLAAERIENWYMLLDGWISTLLPQHTLGQWRTAYGIEWLHARATQNTPLQNVWFADHYWPTVWSATNMCQQENNNVVGHSIERWSFLGHRWHIQHWMCENSDDDTWESVYISQVASPIAVRNALTRTLMLDENTQHASWQSIPPELRAQSLLDWTLNAPENDHRVIPFLSQNLGTPIADLSARLDLARALQTPASTILESMALQSTMWALPLEEDG